MNSAQSLSPVSSPQGTIVSLAQPVSEIDTKVAALMEQVIRKKEENIQEKLQKRTSTLKGRVVEATLIGGDLFSVGYLAFQGAQIVKPSLSKIGAVGMTTLVCGCVAGAVNIGVALVCFYDAIEHFRTGDTAKAFRLLLDGVGLLAIGIIMCLISLAIKVGALSGLGAFFTAHPWLMPVLFFIISLPLVYEIGNSIYNIKKENSLSAQLLSKGFKEIGKEPKLKLPNGKEIDNPFYFGDFEKEKLTLANGEFIENSMYLGNIDDLNDAEKQQKIAMLYNFLSEKLEILSQDMGVEAAVEVFKLLKLNLAKEKTEEQWEIVKAKISAWNRAQYVRMFQQGLYIAAFVVSMAALKPSMNTAAVNGAQTFAMSGANFIPLYMDIFWPFKRNTPIAVEKAEMSAEDYEETIAPLMPPSSEAAAS